MQLGEVELGREQLLLGLEDGEVRRDAPVELQPGEPGVLPGRRHEPLLGLQLQLELPVKCWRELSSGEGTASQGRGHSAHDLEDVGVSQRAPRRLSRGSAGWCGS